MTEQSLAEYIKSLKPGDGFWVDDGRYGHPLVSRDTVVRTTPTGQITGQKARYMSNGRMMGDFIGARPQIVTPSHGAALVLRQRVRNACRWTPPKLSLGTEDPEALAVVEAAQRAYEATVKQWSAP